MSFSTQVKDELLDIKPGKECCYLSQLLGVIRTSGLLVINKATHHRLHILTENERLMAWIIDAVAFLGHVYPIAGKSKSKKTIKYIVEDHMQSLLEKGLIFLGESNYWYGQLKLNKCCRESYLRGCFLAAGTIGDPQKSYHLEMVSKEDAIIEELCDILIKMSLNAKIVERKSQSVVYLKESEDIVAFLGQAGAYKALMQMENIRIMKEVRNNVNRLTNCEDANIQKTVNASYRQIQNIKLLQENCQLDSAPDNLKEIALIRIQYPEASLSELGSKLSVPIGRSGVNHRLRKLDEMAEKLKNGRIQE